MDNLLVRTISSVLAARPNMVIMMLADHGHGYHKHPKDPAGFVELLSPHLALILPAAVVRDHPELEHHLFTNMQRYITHFDLHKTLKAFMHFPNYEQSHARGGKRGYFAPSPGEEAGSKSYHTDVRGVRFCVCVICCCSCEPMTEYFVLFLF